MNTEMRRGVYTRVRLYHVPKYVIDLHEKLCNNIITSTAGEVSSNGINRAATPLSC